MTSWTWALSIRSSWYSRNGEFATGTIGFGVFRVRGRSRVPFPPARISPFMKSLPTHFYQNLAPSERLSLLESRRESSQRTDFGPNFRCAAAGRAADDQRSHADCRVDFSGGVSDGPARRLSGPQARSDYNTWRSPGPRCGQTADF